MRSSRVALAVLALSSICGAVAHSQGAGSAAVDLNRDPDDDEPAGSAAARAGGPPVAQVAPVPSEPRARLAWLRDRVAAAIAAQPKLAKATIAVSVVDVTSGDELVAREPDRAVSVASAAKLLTASAALATLGGGFRWRTTVHGADPDDKGVVAGALYVKGHGDPMLGVAELRALAADVAARGVRSVDRLVIDTSYFDDAVEPPRFEDQKAESAGFRAPVASLGVARSAVNVIVVADPGGAAHAALDPDPGPGATTVALVNKGLTSAPRGPTHIDVKAKPRRDRLELEVSGQIRWGEGSWETRKRVAAPGKFAGEVFRRALIERGVKVKAKAVGAGTVPPAAKQLAAHESPTLAEVVRLMNKTSDNYLAECVLKTLGAEGRASPGPASWADGLAARATALARLGLPPGSYRAENGSGLFDATSLSAHQLTALLRAAHRDFRVGPDLLASLPVGGVDGTLSRRWVGRPARGLVRAKTGTLDKVIALAGYIAVDAQHPLGFAIVVNDITPGQRASARATSDDIVDALAAYLGAP